MSDLRDIEKQVYDEERVEELLEKMGCQHIKPKSSRYEAMLPEKFSSNNIRSVQVSNTENLRCAVRSRSLSNISIYDLVSYIVFDCDEEESIKKNLSKSKRWICEQLGYLNFLTKNFQSEEKEDDPLSWLKSVKKNRAKEINMSHQNEVIDETILNQFIMFPSYRYFLEGLSFEIQNEYQIGYDLRDERIVFPIRNEFGELISVKGRTTDPYYKINGTPKFMYYVNYNKMIEWYHLNIALYYILEKKEVIIFEAEKSCWFAAQYGYMNTIAIGGTDISIFQVEILKRLPSDVRIIFAFDKDKTPKDVMREAIKFGKFRRLYTFWDKENLLSLELKQSPVDKGKEVFEMLYLDSLHRKLN